MSAPLPPGCVLACPGCSHRGFSAQESVSQKRNWLGRALEPWAEAISEVRSVPEAHRLGYREKTLIRMGWQEDRWKYGMRIAKPGRRKGKDRYALVGIPDCPVHSPRVRGILERLSRAVPRDAPWIFTAISGEIATLVFKDSRLPELPELPLDGLRGIFANLNPGAGNRTFSNKGWRLLAGEACAKTETGFEYGPQSFQQLLPSLYEDSIREAARFLCVGPGDLVLDLCSGIGMTLKVWKAQGARTLGVELSGEAVECANRNLGEDLSLRGRVSERLPQLDTWLKEGGGRRRLVFANPPRLGLESEVLRWLGVVSRPERIAYLSCSAGTLSRDLCVLREAGYGVNRIIPYDFFPQTPHVETLALLERKS